MWTPAQVHEPVVTVDGHHIPGLDLRFVHRPDYLELVGVVTEQLQPLRSGHLLPHEGLVSRDDPFHLLLDRVQVFGREWPSDVEVVVETVRNGGADGKGGVLEQPEDRLRHYVGGRVPEDVASLLRIRRDDREPAPGPDRLLQVHQDAIDRHRDGRSSQARTDRSGHLESGDSGLMAGDGVIRKD